MTTTSLTTALNRLITTYGMAPVYGVLNSLFGKSDAEKIACLIDHFSHR